MIPLADWQRQFQQGLLHQGVPAAVAGTATVPSGRRFDIYTSAYRLRLTEALKANYPVLHQALGDEQFTQLAVAYLQAHPSSHANIRWFGDRLDDFVRGQGALLPHPALADLIRLEWALCCAFDASDREILQGTQLAQIPVERWPALVFDLHPSVHLIALEWGVETLWNAAKAADHGQEAPTHDPHYTLVWRQQLGTRFRSLERGEAMLLLELSQAACFARICELAASIASDDAPTLAVSLLQRWLQDQLLTECRLLPE
ncbi:MAG: putative DNA-binding domain-containing protein, partial [Gammaproteobacteria bacterium]|nr:putative DNA-binding domain-containing protein [Gammaproteobacteria bacterium]